MAFNDAASYVLAIKTLWKRYPRSGCQVKALENGWRERIDKGVTIPYAFPCQLKLSHLSLRYSFIIIHRPSTWAPGLTLIN